MHPYLFIDAGFHMRAHRLPYAGSPDSTCGLTGFHMRARRLAHAGPLACTWEPAGLHLADDMN